MTYANGPSYGKHVDSNGGRTDFTKVVNFNNKDYEAPALAPLKTGETHGADDVAVFANGPWAHLFTGNYEQNMIPHMMAYAASIERGGASTTLPSAGLAVLVAGVILRMFNMY